MLYLISVYFFINLIDDSPYSYFPCFYALDMIRIGDYNYTGKDGTFRNVECRYFVSIKENRNAC